MRITRGLSNLHLDWDGGIIALGFFDGLHKGHQEILRRAFLLRDEISVPVMVFTFDRHPMEVVKRTEKSSSPPKLLTTLEEKIQLMEEYQVDHLLIGEFTEEFSHISPEEFINMILCRQLKAKAVIAGFNYRFGYKHQGDMEFLIKTGSHYDFKVIVVPPVYNGDHPVSSTLIRQLVLSGKMMDVEPLLWRWYSLHGIVEKGKGRGMELGFPTANLLVPSEKLLPKDGVYVSVVRRGESFCPAVMNIGMRPTFKEQSRTVEVHLIDTTLDLYGETIEVYILTRLRGEKRFDNQKLLIDKIKDDIKRTKQILQVHTSKYFAR